jgi:hypothetical protein
VIDRIEQARDLVRQRRLPRTLRRVGEEDDGLSYYDGFGTDELDTEVTSDVLARSLHYMIRLKLTSVSDEFELPLGASKHKGLPHLPPDLEWPGTHYFFAQFNLAELHPLDLYDAFPAGGMLYIFFDPAGEVSVIHYDGPLDSLRVVPYPSSAKDFTGAKYYLDQLPEAALTHQVPAAMRLLPRQRRLRPVAHDETNPQRPARRGRVHPRRTGGVLGHGLPHLRPAVVLAGRGRAVRPPAP